jgi:16S rRNA (uracil1498-N3)-methyltransferase
VVRVHRLKVGDRFDVFDPARGVEAEAEIEELPRGGSPALRVRVGDVRAASVLPARRVTLVQALSKGEKMDAIVRDATELGATRVAPAIAERSVARPDDVAGRADRYRRIAAQAARQCGRGDAPRIDVPAPLASILAEFAGRSDVAGLVLDPSAQAPLRSQLLHLSPEAEVVFVVGPEGGLSGAELNLCERSGLVRVSLGRFTLRTETVCAAVLGALLVLAAPDPAP